MKDCDNLDDARAEIAALRAERDGFASMVAEIRASLKDDQALCASIRGALMATHEEHPDVPTSHRAAKRVVGALVNVLDNLILRHVEHEAGHDVKTLCREILKLRHGGTPGTDLDRQSPASRNRAFVKLEKLYIQTKAREASLRTALEFYAEANHYSSTWSDDLSLSVVAPMVTGDRGRTARAALEIREV